MWYLAQCYLCKEPLTRHASSRPPKNTTHPTSQLLSFTRCQVTPYTIVTIPRFAQTDDLPHYTSSSWSDWPYKPLLRWLNLKCALASGRCCAVNTGRDLNNKVATSKYASTSRAAPKKATKKRGEENLWTNSAIWSFASQNMLLTSNNSGNGSRQHHCLP